VPDVVCGVEAQRVRGPTPDQVRTGHRHLDDVGTAPVVADKVDRLTELLQAADEPVSVARHGRLERSGCGYAEARGRQRNRVVALEFAEQRPPDRRVLWVAVD